MLMERSKVDLPGERMHADGGGSRYRSVASSAGTRAARSGKKDRTK